MTLSEYLFVLRREIERLDTFGFAETIDFSEELRAGKQAIIRVEVALVDGSVLVIREYIDAKYGIEKMSYAYHFQRKDGSLIFRYDNAVHRPALGYRNHKHTAEGLVIEASPPDFQELFEEVIIYV